MNRIILSFILALLLAGGVSPGFSTEEKPAEPPVEIKETDSKFAEMLELLELLEIMELLNDMENVAALEERQ